MNAGFGDEMRAFGDKARQEIEKRRQLQGSVPLTDAYSPEFIRQHTSYRSLDEMLEAAGVTAEQAFATEPPAAWESFVRDRSGFASWDAMRAAAHDAYLKRRAGG